MEISIHPSIQTEVKLHLRHAPPATAEQWESNPEVASPQYLVGWLSTQQVTSLLLRAEHFSFLKCSVNNLSGAKYFKKQQQQKKKHRIKIFPSVTGSSPDPPKQWEDKNIGVCQSGAQKTTWA